MKTNKPVKPKKAYARVDAQGNIDVDSIETKAKYAKASGCYMMPRYEWWEMLKRQGYRCIRVEIRELKR